jgi:S1-C subfamily serine protease
MALLRTRTPVTWTTIALRLVLTSLAALPTVLWAADSTDTASVENAVVKIFSTSRSPDPFKPWAKQSPRDSSGTGVVIEGNRILTNAHVVLHSSQVQVQANQSGDKLDAKVIAIAPGIDLAVLQLEDESFFKTHPPLPRASKMPEIKDAVLAYGYPTGGTSLSITKGIVSRIEYTSYNFPVSGLRIQIDAAINPGNSGGPAVADNKMIGLAFSRLNGAQSIGYIIPNEEIDLFLVDIADGRYDGKPDLYDDLQTLENPALRPFLKIGKDVRGIIVRRPFREDPAYPLKQWDIITHIGNTPVDSLGMVQLTPELRVRFRYLVPRVTKDGMTPLTVVRDGKPLKLNVPVSADHPMLIPDLLNGYPPYFVYGPMVFSKATAQFTAAIQNNGNMMAAFGSARSPLVTRRGDAPDASTEELVIVSSPMFPHKLSTGYSNPTAMVIQSVNGTPIRSLRHLVAVLRDLKDEFSVFEMDSRGSETVVFNHKETLAATEDILADNGIRSQGSDAIMDVWKGKAQP